MECWAFPDFQYSNTPLLHYSAYERGPAQPLLCNSVEFMVVGSDYLRIQAIGESHAEAIGKGNSLDVGLVETGSLPKCGIHVFSDAEACSHEASDQSIGPVNV